MASYKRKQRSKKSRRDKYLKKWGSRDTLYWTDVFYTDLYINKAKYYRRRKHKLKDSDIEESNMPFIIKTQSGKRILCIDGEFRTKQCITEPLQFKTYISAEKRAKKYAAVVQKVGKGGEEYL